MFGARPNWWSLFDTNNWHETNFNPNIIDKDLINRHVPINMTASSVSNGNTVFIGIINTINTVVVVDTIDIDCAIISHMIVDNFFLPYLELPCPHCGVRDEIKEIEKE